VRSLVHAHATAVQRAACAVAGSTAFGTGEECRAADEAAYKELAGLVFPVGRWAGSPGLLTTA